MARGLLRQPAVVTLLLLFFCLALYQMHVANVRIPISKGLDITRLPKEYERTNSQSEYCENRFGKDYLHAFEGGSASYCDETSSSHLTCFSNNVDPTNQQTDSFCIGGPAVFDPKQQQFTLQCRIRSILPEELESGIVPLSEFTAYPHQTGTLHTFGQYVNFADDDDPALIKDTKASPTAVLVRREESQNNIWASLLEIMSTYLTLDILRMTIDPARGTHYFTSSEFDNTQIIILDTIEEGNYFDLWHLFARKPIIHISNLTALETSTFFKNIITPLPGASNPWHQTPQSTLPCSNSTLLRAFSSRVLYAYNIATSSTRLLASPQNKKQQQPTPIQLTFINRLSHRRLLQYDRLLALLRLTFPPTTLSIHIIDYAALSFPSQLSVTHDNTDILIGVSGAGLTHTMFLKDGSAVIELVPFNQPADPRYENLALMMEDVEYHQGLTEDETKETGAKGNWEMDDVWVTDKKFLALMTPIVNSMAKKRGLL